MTLLNLRHRFSLKAQALPGICCAALLCACADTVSTVPGAEAEVQLSLSLAPAMQTTRQAAAVVQAEETTASFRGIRDIYILPFAERPTAESRPLSSTVRLFSMLRPIQRTVGNAIPAVMDVNHAALFGGSPVPLGTQAVVFYGEAAPSALRQSDLPAGTLLSALPAADVADYEAHKNGMLLRYGLSLLPTTPVGAVQFGLQSIATDAGVEADEKHQAILHYLNAIAAALNADERALDLYGDFLNNRAASSANLRELLRNLYFEAGGTEDGAGHAGTYSALLEAILAGFTDGNVGNPLKPELAGYPANLHLPDGLAAVAYDEETRQFHAATSEFYAAPFQAAPVHTYVYPAPLCYFGNSRLLVSDDDSEEWYVTTRPWSEICDDYTPGPVAKTTKSVAIEDPVQYAVARLDVQLKASNGTLPAEGGQNVALAQEGFPVTAILVSNQHTVDWQFLPQEDGGSIVYDNALSGIYAPPGTYGATIHTLLFQTPDCGKTSAADDAEDEARHSQHVVRVAFELVNNSGMFFRGYQGQLVPPGCHFYLVGELDPTQAANFSADTPGQRRVLTRDCLTQATFVIHSLEKAYNVIPDLRAPFLEIGLRINTNWQVGYHFTEDPLYFR